MPGKNSCRRGCSASLFIMQAHLGRRIASYLLFAIAGHFAGVGITRARIASLHFDFVRDIDRLLPGAHRRDRGFTGPELPVRRSS